MRHPAGRRFFLAFATLTLLLSGAAQASDRVPLKNWAVPQATSGSRPSTLGALGDAGNPAIFVPFAPCRMVDTRGGGVFTGSYGPPALAASTARDFEMTSASGPCPGIPYGATAISLNVTVVNTAGPGFIMIYPQGGAVPTVSTLNYNAGQVLANAAIVPMNSSGGITVVAGVSGTDLILDVNGYYINSQGNLTPGEYFHLAGSTPGSLIRGENWTLGGTGGAFYAGGAGSTGVRGEALTTGVKGTALGSANGSVGVSGLANSSSGQVYGVYGQSMSATAGTSGVFGEATGSGEVYGVFGRTASATMGASGVVGEATGSGEVYGVNGRTASATTGASGVVGEATGSGEVYGTVGRSTSSATGSAGVLGSAGSPGYPNNVSTGVVGVLGTTTSGYGVFGKATATGIGVRGAKVDATTGVPTASGVLGYLTSWGVYSYNDLGATGTKSFVEPHPTDASRQIVYVAMEGPEAGTYFRGRGRFDGKSAVIVVPEDFRLVTEEEGLTVQITPMGRATTWVNRAGLDAIEAESTADVEFSYLVQGVRKNYKGHEPIQKNTLFVPMGFDARMEPYPAHIQKRLVDLGIYKADGSVNLETAERMGWAQTWREEAAAEQAAAAKAAREQDVRREAIQR